MQVFSNPARLRNSKELELYPYYAGFSEAFVADALGWIEPNQNSMLLDPWNGAGTTTRIASTRQVNSMGFDLNPVMVLVAKAELIDRSDALVLLPLARKILEFSLTLGPKLEELPLAIFFDENTAQTIRALALAAWLHLVDSNPPALGTVTLRNVAPLSAIFFVGIFNVVRALLIPLSTSNPTWIRVPTPAESRITRTTKDVFDAFLSEMERLSKLISCRQALQAFDVETTIDVADSRTLPIENESIDAIITSPPYCTRLDYGRTTMPELLVLESLGIASYQAARQELMGASIARHFDALEPKIHWGETCKLLLNRIYEHPSKASKGYYYISHFAYFDDIASSISEISRVLRTGGKVCLVAQDSFYKEIHNDLPRIVAEMAAEVKLKKVYEFRYQKKNSICRINSASAVYRKRRIPIEVALLFEKG